MKKEYNFSKMKELKNPYAGKKKAVGINLSPEVVDYFKALASKTGLPYQKLIDLCLLECAKKRKKTDDAMGGVTTSQSCLFPPRGLRKSREGNAKVGRGGGDRICGKSHKSR